MVDTTALVDCEGPSTRGHIIPHSKVPGWAQGQEWTPASEFTSKWQGPMSPSPTYI